MFEHQFYPTPFGLAERMAAKVNINAVKSVLEPGGGKGDLAEAIVRRLNINRSGKRRDELSGLDIDIVEIDENLRYILKGKGFRVVYDDFMHYHTNKEYDLILMNPPFSEGTRQLNKALDMLEGRGGQVVCLLNAETLRLAYTNERKALLTRLNDLGAEIEYHQDQFLHAEMVSPVEVALVYVNIPKKEPISSIYEGLQAAQTYSEEPQDGRYRFLVENDFIKVIIRQFEIEAAAGVNLIREYQAMKPHMLRAYRHPDDKFYKDKPIITLHVDDGQLYPRDITTNEYLRLIRRKYWEALLANPRFTGKLTTNLRDMYLGDISRLDDFDFTLFNILTIRVELQGQMLRCLEETILSLFEELSNKHHWYSETSKNIHYYNGWASNRAYKVNQKVVIPLNVYRTYGAYVRFYPTAISVVDKLTDIEKVFSYLSGTAAEGTINQVLESIQKSEETKNIDFKYFTLTFYKKGTCHIRFKDERLLKKFNIFGGQRKGWLPPTYGKARYEDMDSDSKAVVDSFEGADAYRDTMLDTRFYIFDSVRALAIEAGDTAGEGAA